MREITDQAAERRRVALVLSGGGARAAYQVGVLRALARARPDLRLPIITGVSAGAINAAFLAASVGSFGEAVERLSDLWWSLDVHRVFRVDARSLLGHVAGWGARLVSGGGTLAPRVRGLVDTSPLQELLTDALGAEPDGGIPGIANALERGRLQSFTLITSNFGTGQSVVWVAGREVEAWERPNRRSVACRRITVSHVMASAALPIFFPAVELDGSWHGDGGIRLVTPLSPAIHLGADRILAISTRYRRTIPEADRPAIQGYPPPVQILGQLLNAVFLDMLDQDCMRIERLNLLLRELPEEKRHGLRLIDVGTVRPSQDLGTLAGQHEPDLPKVFRYLVRSLGSRETASPDLLSLLMFQPGYLRRLIEIGEADGDANLDEMLRLVDGP